MYLPRYKPKAIQAITLIELLIVLTLATLVFMILLQIYHAIWRGFYWQKNFLQIQHNHLKLQSIFRKEIALAGHIGCSNLENVSVVSHDYSFSSATKLIGTADTFMVQYADFPNSMLLAHDARSLKISSNIHYKIGDVLIISNCYAAEIFKVAKAHWQNKQFCIHPDKALTIPIEPPAEISRLIKHKFYINKNKLFREDINKRKILLMENVSNMQIFYYIGLKKKAWNKVHDWRKLRAVSIQLSLKNDAVETKSFLIEKLNHVTSV